MQDVGNTKEGPWEYKKNYKRKSHPVYSVQIYFESKKKNVNWKQKCREKKGRPCHMSIHRTTSAYFPFLRRVFHIIIYVKILFYISLVFFATSVKHFTKSFLFIEEIMSRGTDSLVWCVYNISNIWHIYILGFALANQAFKVEEHQKKTKQRNRTKYNLVCVLGLNRLHLFRKRI